MKTFLKLALSLCLCAIAPRTFAQIQIDGSYLNISRPNGGPVAVGDTLEIHAVISILSGNTLTNVSYTDVIANNVTYMPQSMKSVTNENKIISGIANTSTYTDASGDDKGQYQAGAKKITITMGTGASASTGGTITGGTTPPLFYNVASIFMITYRVVVTGPVGATIELNAGVFKYTQNGTIYNINITSKTLYISPVYTCVSSNSTNYMTAETNGTFSSGTAANRSASPNVTGYTFINLAHDNPSDGQYSIVKNTSPTLYTGTTPAAADRVFNDWDVFGDHTGTTTGTGNPAPNSSQNSGYMLVVNATYAPAIVFSSTITGLTASTTYTVSFWVRNICPICGNDPASGNANNTPGVKPNLGIYLNGLNYFSTGDLAYTGEWVYKSFTFNAGTSTTVALDIRNNAPGGGGNDWALDDISITKCLSYTLPVTFASFTGVARPDAAILTWQTASEINAHNFEIERSLDGAKFITIGSTLANGTPSSYQYTDYSAPWPDKVYYRLRMIDTDGTASYSKVIALQQETSNNVLKASLFPTPSRSNTTLFITTTQPGNANISILNIGGATLHTQNATLTSGQNTVLLQPTRQLTAGLYLVRVTIASRTIWTKWLIQ